MPRQINLCYILPSGFFNVYFKITLPSTARFSKWFLFSPFPAGTLHAIFAFSFPASCICHFTLFVLSPQLYDVGNINMNNVIYHCVTSSLQGQKFPVSTICPQNLQPSIILQNLSLSIMTVQRKGRN